MNHINRLKYLRKISEDEIERLKNSTLDYRDEAIEARQKMIESIDKFLDGYNHFLDDIAGGN